MGQHPRLLVAERVVHPGRVELHHELEDELCHPTRHLRVRRVRGESRGGTKGRTKKRIRGGESREVNQGGPSDAPRNVRAEERGMSLSVESRSEPASRAAGTVRRWRSGPGGRQNGHRRANRRALTQTRAWATEEGRGGGNGQHMGTQHGQRGARTTDRGQRHTGQHSGQRGPNAHSTGKGPDGGDWRSQRGVTGTPASCASASPSCIRLETSPPM